MDKADGFVGDNSSLKRYILKLKQKSKNNFLDVDEANQEFILNSLVKDFENTFLSVLTQYKHIRYQNSQVDFHALDGNVLKYQNFVLIMIIRYGETYKTDILDWDDFKIAYWLGFFLAKIENDKSYLLNMLDVCNALMYANNKKMIHNDMLQKMKLIIDSNPKNVMKLFDENHFGTCGVYFAIKTLDKS